ncbi:MAG: CtsR family transcriptional regulator [Limnochordia bacterium]|jgi:transcriptional regulator CtsR
MATLADAIERYLKRMLERAGEGVIEIRRVQLAEEFSCVPSQINYVLETRFTPEKGYIVESRRGGGGYIRIFRVLWGSPPHLFQHICDSIGEKINQRSADSLLTRLRELRALDEKQDALIRGALRRETAGLQEPWNDILRASLLKAMLMMAFQES